MTVHHLKDKLLAMPANITLDEEQLKATNTLAYHGTEFVKKFYHLSWPEWSTHLRKGF